MPLYTYCCHPCRHEWSVRRYITERDQPIQCPICQSWHVWKKPDAANFRIKGFSAKNGYSRDS